jgi:hypothetical protein
LQPHADSQDFSGPSGQNIQSGVAVFGKASFPTRWIQLYATPLAARCLTANLGALTETVHPASLSLPRIGDGAVAIRYAASNGNSIDVLFARRGRSLAYLGVLRPTGIDETALLGRMTERLSAAA